ncbi:MAG TPA: dienelactone hydrolase family protein [Tepidisphaeraceae bacterium]|jgi:carboxymethylenebutenolidase|nr:dienelactone hydrolase family protein [Tepidisphaeraceae bacterium]
MNQNKIDIKTPDGVAGCYVFHPPGDGPWPAVIFYMDGIAIRPALLAMAERLATSGYYVLLPDLFYRAGPYAPFDPSTVFSGGPERERLMKLMGCINNGLAMRDTGAFLDYLARQPSVAGSKVGCTGYCMGGRFALLAAGTYPDRIAAAASFHGGSLATDAADSPHLVAGKIRASVYIGVAGIDPYFPDAEKERLETALETAGVRHQLEVYPGVHHGFTMTDVPVYDREAAERHWQRLGQLLREAQWRD